MKATKLISMLAVLAMTSVAAASEDGFKISGDFAASYFGESSGKGSNSAGFNHDVISLDLTEINLAKTLGNSGIMLGIGYGAALNFNGAVDAATSGVKPTLNLTNTYFWHKVGDTGLTVKLGKFSNGIGHESYNFMDNLNYTRSYGFGWQPVFMTGVNVGYSQTMFDVGLSVGNSIRNTDTDENGNKMIHVSGAVRPMEGMVVKANYMTGKDGTGAASQDDYSLINAEVGYKWNMMDFALDYTMATNDPVNELAGTNTKEENTSIALYAGYSMDNWGAGLRYEMAEHDAEGSATALHTSNLAGTVDEKISAITATAHYDIDQNARVKAEIGMQKGEDASFVDNDGNADDSMMVYGLGMMYRF